MRLDGMFLANVLKVFLCITISNTRIHRTMLFTVVFGTVAVGLLLWLGHRITSFISGSAKVKMVFSPNELCIKEVVLVILLMLGRSVLSMFHKPKECANQVSLFSPFRLSKYDIARYRDAIGLSTGKYPVIGASRLPLFLSAVTEPAILLLLASPCCPINPLGAANVCNTFEFFLD
jgi:hypothetical protein